MNKIEMIKNYTEQINTMLSENAAHEIAFALVVKKEKAIEERTAPNWNLFHEELEKTFTREEKEIWRKGNVKHRKSRFKRIRLELSKLLLEIEKEFKTYKGE